jgi:DNA topoisomerase-1
MAEVDASWHAKRSCSLSPVKLVLVESPAKCKKIEGFLGPGWRVLASYGHIRDLPDGDLGIDFGEARIVPHWKLTERAGAVVERLKREAERAEAVYLATDPDREGEAIAWHLAEVLGERSYQRAAFNSITRAAVHAAVSAPRPLDRRLVDAQQARRVLDRVVGWAVSPTCSKGTGRKDARSAGRVQSVALRLVVERELEIRDFKPETYYVPVATLAVPGKPPAFKAWLVEWKGEALGRRLTDKLMAEKVVDWCRRQPWRVIRAEKSRVQIHAPPPFITSTLQQAASVRLKLSPQETMKLAQSLYEDGAITYMRTDSTALTPEAVAMARAHISANFAKEYLPERPPGSRAAGANAQEAHEAIRPTSLEGGAEAAGEGPKGELYRLIWERFVASQMAPGIDQRAVVDVACAPDGYQHPERGRMHAGIFRARGTTVVFDGWRRLTDDAAAEKPKKGERADDRDEEDVEESRLPDLAGKEDAELRELGAPEKVTKAPPRYTEASLIKLLEKKGVGRPSTYASIMATIISRGYVELKRRKLHATELGIVLARFLIRAYAGNFIEPDFTNRIENGLDRIASGEEAWEPFVQKAAREVVGLARKAGLWYDPLVPQPARK